jgi:hypothetical protein
MKFCEFVYQTLYSQRATKKASYLSRQVAGLYYLMVGDTGLEPVTPCMSRVPDKIATNRHNALHTAISTTYFGF